MQTPNPKQTLLGPATKGPKPQPYWVWPRTHPPTLLAHDSKGPTPKRPWVRTGTQPQPPWFRTPTPPKILWGPDWEGPKPLGSGHGPSPLPPWVRTPTPTQPIWVTDREVPAPKPIWIGPQTQPPWVRSPNPTQNPFGSGHGRTQNQTSLDTDNDPTSTQPNWGPNRERPIPNPFVSETIPQTQPMWRMYGTALTRGRPEHHLDLLSALNECFKAWL